MREQNIIYRYLNKLYLQKMYYPSIILPPYTIFYITLWRKSVSCQTSSSLFRRFNYTLFLRTFHNGSYLAHGNFYHPKNLLMKNTHLLQYFIILYHYTMSGLYLTSFCQIIHILSQLSWLPILVSVLFQPLVLKDLVFFTIWNDGENFLPWKICMAT